MPTARMFRRAPDAPQTVSGILEICRSAAMVRAFLLLGVLVAGVGCSSLLIDPQVPAVPQHGADTAQELYQPPLEDVYRIRVGDRLSIRSYYDTQLDQEAVVRRDGRISLLLLNDVEVVGRSTDELSKTLSSRYAEHIRATDVTVSVVESSTLSVYVGGDVRVSSEQVLDGPLTVVQAITAAGGLKPSANGRQVLVLRRQSDGQFVAYQLDMEKVLVGQASDVYLRGYDIVHVPMTRVAHVGRFIDQYVNQIIPEAFRFNANYNWIDSIDGNETQSVQVIQP